MFRLHETSLVPFLIGLETLQGYSGKLRVGSARSDKLWEDFDHLWKNDSDMLADVFVDHFLCCFFSLFRNSPCKGFCD